MAKKRPREADGASGRTSVRRAYPDPENKAVLGPVFVDHSMVALGSDAAIHSLYQTRLPTGPLVAANDTVETLLVGRFVYSQQHFRELTQLFVTQLIQLEKIQNKADFLSWLQQEVKRRGSAETPEKTGEPRTH
jgi:hypothetical protein